MLPLLSKYSLSQNARFAKYNIFISKMSQRVYLVTRNQINSLLITTPLPKGVASLAIRCSIFITAEPMKQELESASEATDEERATYYEKPVLWARWKTDQYA